jgi:suppressor of fused-like protein
MVDPDEHDVDPEAVGWAAIDAALESLYAGQVPKHYGTLVSWRLGGPDPLPGISAYRRERPRPHWHFVTYGFSDLYAKETDHPDESGYGFELTFRLADDALAADADRDPPAWALGLLQNLARYVFQSGNAFEAGHYMDLNGPIALGHDTSIRAVVFAPDPELAGIDTPNGRVRFLQVVGVTLDELAACKRWNTLAALDVLAPSMPLLVTDLSRGSLLADAGVAATLQAGSARDGSSTGFLFLDRVAWRRHKPLLRAARYEVDIGAGQVEELRALLPARLPFGRRLLLVGSVLRVEFVPGVRNAIVEDQDGATLRIELDAQAGEALARSLRPVAGTVPVPGFDGLRLQVHRTEILDRDGNVVGMVG